MFDHEALRDYFNRRFTKEGGIALPTLESDQAFDRLLNMTRADRRDIERQKEWARILRFVAQVEEATDAQGFVQIAQSSMDCDGVTSFTTWKVRADKVRLEFDQVYEWAEGPTSVWVVPLHERHKIDREVKEFTPRDLVLEAFEDGHPHVLYL